MQNSFYERSLIEASLDPLVAISAEGKITDMNEALASITGISREKLVSTDFFSYFTEPEKASAVYQEVFAKGSIANFPLTLRHKNGKLSYVLFNGSVYKDKSGTVLGVVVVGRSITSHNSDELASANKELLFQNEEKEKRANELAIANKELLFQNEEKGKRADELIIANKELEYQTEEKGKRAAELVIADKELEFQNREKHKREIANQELEALSYSLKLASQYSRSLIEASIDPLVTISPEGKITDVNEASAKVTGETRQKLIGTDFSDYFTEPEKAREGYKQVFEKGSVSDYPLTIRHKNGSLIDVLYNASVYKDDKGTVLGVFAAARDVTDKNRIAAELTEAKEFAELATGIAEEAKRKAESATIIAEDAVKAKQQFLSSMSHEIRTPLNGIIGFTKILLRDVLTDTQRKQLEAVKTSSDILLVLINDILDLAKIEAGQMNIEKIGLKLSDLINTVLGTFELRFEEKELRIRKRYDDKIPQILLGDPVRISQILLNLLSNSFKFTPNRGQISINVNLLNQDEENASVEFVFTDTGIGISPEKLSIIFEPFIQSSSDTARRYGGTGLGLSIVKRLVTLMDGTISVASKLDEGTTVTFVLPLKKTTATEISREKDTILLAQDLKDLGQLNILLVEDIPVNQFLALTILDDFGFKVDTAENGKIAIEMLEKNDYDIILMDLMMPEMGGFEATQYIRTKMHSSKSNIPIIALTADVNKSDVDKCHKVGMNDYVSKPFNPTDLMNKIIRLLKKTEKICNLDHLKAQSPKKPEFVSKMIQLLLKQIPVSIEEMHACLKSESWQGLGEAAHKLRPSIVMIGMDKELVKMTLQIEEYAFAKKNLDLIPKLVQKLRTALERAFIELEEELKNNYSGI